MKAFAFLIACVVAGAGVSFAAQEGAVFPGVIEPSREIDARIWLHTPHPGNDLAGKKFIGRKEAERLVERLYDAGALRVTVVFLMGDAEGFRVEMPSDIDRRHDVLYLVNVQLTKEGFAEISDSGQESVIVWLK